MLQHHLLLWVLHLLVPCRVLHWSYWFYWFYILVTVFKLRNDWTLQNPYSAVLSSLLAFIRANLLFLLSNCMIFDLQNPTYVVFLLRIVCTLQNPASAVFTLHLSCTLSYPAFDVFTLHVADTLWYPVSGIYTLYMTGTL